MISPKTQYSYKAQIIQAILTDDLEEAKKVLREVPEGFKLMAAS